MCHLPACTLPTVSAAELQIHEPERKMQGACWICAKLVQQCILCALRATPPEPLPLPGCQGEAHLRLT